MADGHGGHRVPENPAGASGPGRLSKRTDGAATQAAKYVKGLEYGEGEKLMATQQAAPMSKAPSADKAASMASKAAKKSGKEKPLMGEPSMRPDEPVTAGSPVGPGEDPYEEPAVHLPPDVLAEAALRAFIVNPSTENLAMFVAANS